MRQSSVFSILLLLLFNSAATAMLTDEVVVEPYVSALDHPNLDKRISVDLKDINISDIIRYLGDKADVNIAISKNVGGRAVLSFDDVTIRDALELTLISNDLAAEKRGEIIYILTGEEYETRYGEPWADAREVKMFQINHAKASDVLDAITILKSSVGNIVVNDERGTVIIMDTPDRMAGMMRAIAVMDRELLTQIFELKHAQAKDLEEKLAARLDDKGVGTIKAEERTNQLIVTAIPGMMEQIERIIKELDKVDRQVLIEAKIVKVSLNPDYDMGIDWQYLSRSGESHSATIDSMLPFPTSEANFGSVTLGSLSEDSYTGVIKFLKTIGETKLLSSPRISAVHNEEAKILVGAREAYITSTVTQGDTTTTTAESVTFLDVGVQLFVTPLISDDGFVKMKIRPEVSSVVRTITTSEGNEIPIVDTTTAETTVVVKDNHTIIIGGLIKDETLRTTRKVPYLGDIPGLGKIFFRQVREEKEKTELVVFLTPRIIPGDANMDDWDEKSPKGLRGFGEMEARLDETYLQVEGSAYDQ